VEEPTGAPARARTPNPVRRSRTRSAILDAAETQFVTRGFAATSIDLVAPLADVSKGAVYFHFGSKDDLLVALLDRSRTTVFEPALAVLNDAALSPSGRIVGYFNRVGSLEQLHRYLLPILASVQGATIAPEARERIDQLQDLIHSSLVAAVRDGLQAGEFSSPLRAVELASLVQALMDGMLLQWHRNAGEIHGPDFLRAGRHAVLGALGAQHSGRRSSGSLRVDP